MAEQEEVIELLKRAEKEFWTNEGFTWKRINTEDVLPKIQKAISLLSKPKCERCGDIKLIPVEDMAHTYTPCPDCQEPAKPQSEFIKKCKAQMQDIRTAHDAIQIIRLKDIIYTLFEKLEEAVKPKERETYSNINSQEPAEKPEAKCKKCGKLFYCADDYDTLGSETGTICPVCGSEEFEPAEPEQSEYAKLNNSELMDFETRFDGIPFLPFSLAKELYNRLGEAEAERDGLQKYLDKAMQEIRRLDQLTESSAGIIKEAEAENKRLKQAILDYGNNSIGFDWAVLEKIEEQEVQINTYKSQITTIQNARHRSKYTANKLRKDKAGLVTKLKEQAAEIKQLKTYEIFVKHIEGHLAERNKGEYVICKICDKSINEIVEQAMKGE